MKLDETSCVLDLCCGAGRLLEFMPENIAKYRGIDFSSGMIDIARSLNNRDNAEFFTGSILEADKILADEKGTFNRTIIICLKVSVGIGDRLTLKDFYSDKLQSDYSAIYRTRDEYMNIFAQTLEQDGFSITDEGFVFDDSLNNRKETTQYYFILER